jgi:beta-phosphoglucomutase-like phosphatase (HAD superfamily)
MTISLLRPEAGGAHPRDGRDLTLIFDFDGTIADTLAAVVRLANRHHEELGIPRLDEAEVEAMRGMTSRGIPSSS